jgi:hypothetical protein
MRGSLGLCLTSVVVRAVRFPSPSGGAVAIVPAAEAGSEPLLIRSAAFSRPHHWSNVRIVVTRSILRPSGDPFGTHKPMNKGGQTILIAAEGRCMEQSYLSEVRPGFA